MQLDELRNQIDEIDKIITEQFCKRMDVSAKIAKIKAESGQPIYQKSRERQVLLRASEAAGEELGSYARVLYATLMDLSRSYQQQINASQTELTSRVRTIAKNTPNMFPSRGIVACQGVEGAYSQIAADKLFSVPNIMYFRNFEGVFQAVEQGLCQFGVLPIENSSHGSVINVYDLMRHYNFHIVRGLKLHIHHYLMAKPGVKMQDIKEIFSHEQALGQCSGFLANLKGVKITACENTAIAANMVANSNRNDIAAICSHDCGELYGLEIINDNIQNNGNNYTRFICIAKDLAVYPGANKISLMCSVSHKPGSLYNLISKFAALGVNLTKLESRPIAGCDFEFMFYLDLEASVWSDEVMNLLTELSNDNENFAFLGCYSEV